MTFPFIPLEHIQFNSKKKMFPPFSFRCQARIQLHLKSDMPPTTTPPPKKKKRFDKIHGTTLAVVIALGNINPLRPNSDLSQSSHCYIKGLSVSEVMRIENMITQVKFYSEDILDVIGHVTRGLFWLWLAEMHVCGSSLLKLVRF